MDLGKAVIAAGIGCRTRVSAEAVLAAVDHALAVHALARRNLSTLATTTHKRHEPALHHAAAMLGVGLKVVDDDALAAAGTRTLTHSPLSLEATGVPSLSEAAALAAVGPGGRLLGPRIALGSATCALALSWDQA